MVEKLIKFDVSQKQISTKIVKPSMIQRQGPFTNMDLLQSQHG